MNDGTKPMSYMIDPQLKDAQRCIRDAIGLMNAARNCLTATDQGRSEKARRVSISITEAEAALLWLTEAVQS
jgi:hypothetical protein